MKQMIIAALVALLVVGCGRDDSDRDVYSSEYMASTGTKYGWTTVDVSITYNKADWRFKRWLTEKIPTIYGARPRTFWETVYQQRWLTGVLRIGSHTGIIRRVHMPNVRLLCLWHDVAIPIHLRTT